MSDIVKRAVKNPSETDEWFAWHPVRSGALGTGHWMWLERVWRNRCAGVIIYQPPTVKAKTPDLK